MPPSVTVAAASSHAGLHRRSDRSTTALMKKAPAPMPARNRYQAMNELTMALRSVGTYRDAAKSSASASMKSRVSAARPR